MPKIYFDAVEKNVSVGKGTFNVIKGRKTFDNTEWEKRYFASDDSVNAVVFNLKPGDEVNCVTVKDGKFWNLKAVEVINSGGGSSDPGPSDAPAQSGGGTTQQGKDYKKREKVATAGGFREPDEISRTEALKLAIMTVNGMVANAETFSKVFKKTLTLQAVQGATIDLAAAYNGFIKGEITGASPESSKKDLDQTDPETNGDDDIPF